ncbi:tyrosine-type recombinase/integrase [Gloeothece verrucosa]|uniref:Integrase family protein n=1 Tax=Gloeothece verrucosa (strain PCC 7822) TaxID=497965 RepID=E0UCN1_GLOV7|nr:site-specific integrase [Gloeothece verrucosa]ADN14574.1 integrase family protein [Gloeothece verrucosa PCC 7822]ADN15225.1 integrase family protein [Gloeothece verrucosa PCC 7822]ADN16427.1 integrase family protein [Gloeothece verrucosa PCC 7822]
MTGQAASLSNSDWAKLEKHCQSDLHKFIWALLRFTGARVNEVLNLKVSDVYDNNGKPFDYILYRKETRKGKDKNHSVPVTNALHSYLAAYKPPTDGYLFPSDRTSSGHLSYEAVRDYLMKCATSAGLSHKAVKTHSGRRSLITNLISNGVDLRTVQAITGHSSIQNVIRYADSNPHRCKLALEGAYS